VLGALVGYYQSVRGLARLAAGFVMRAADVLQAFPVFVFAIALVAVFGQSLQSIVLGRDELVLLTHPTHPLAGRRRVSLEEVGRQTVRGKPCRCEPTLPGGPYLFFPLR